VRRFQPDILHAHQLGAGRLGAMANYHPFVVTGWGSDILLRSRDSMLGQQLARFTLWKCDQLTVPSQLMYNASRRLGVSESRLRLIPWGVETDIFQPTPDDRMATRQKIGLDLDAKVLFCPRAITDLYNLDTLLEAIAPIAQQNTEKICLVHGGVNKSSVVEHPSTSSGCGYGVS